MEKIWQRIELWLKKNQPDLFSSLRPGASEAQITALEDRIGAQLPKDFRRSAVIHDGQNEYDTGLIDGWELLSLNRIEAEWNVWKTLLDDGEFNDYQSEPEPGIKENWWNERWIPVASDGQGNNLCLDLDPGPGGQSGQIISMWHDSGERTLIASSFEAWLGEFAAGLVSGKVSFEDTTHGSSQAHGLQSGAGSVALHQKYINERREFYLENSRIRGLRVDLDGETEFYVKYENLTKQRRVVTRQDGRLYIAAISFGLFGLVGLVLNLFGVQSLMQWAPLWIVASLIFFAFHIYKRRRYLLIDLDNNTSFFFLYNNPSREKLENFLAEMFKAQRSYLRENYLDISPENNPEDEINKLRWLLHKDAISDVEYQGLLEALENVRAPDPIASSK